MLVPAVPVTLGYHAHEPLPEHDAGGGPGVSVLMSQPGPKLAVMPWNQLALVEFQKVTVKQKVTVWPQAYVPLLGKGDCVSVYPTKQGCASAEAPESKKASNRIRMPIAGGAIKFNDQIDTRQVARLQVASTGSRASTSAGSSFRLPMASANGVSTTCPHTSPSMASCAPCNK